MDHNYNLNQSLNNSGTFNALAPQQIQTGTNVWTGNYPNIQQLAQINSQLGNMNLTDTGTNYLDSYMAAQSSGIGVAQNGISGPYYVASSQPTSPPIVPNMSSPLVPAMTNNVNLTNSGLMQQPAIPPTNLNLTFAQNGQIPMKYDSSGVISPLSPEEFALFLQFQNNIMTGTEPSGNKFVKSPSIPQGEDPVPVTIPGPVSPASTCSGSELNSPGTPNNNSKRVSIGRRQTHNTISETSSNASSTSIPGSPTSIGGISSFSLPDSAISPRDPSPEAEMPNGEIRTGNVPIRSHSLKYTVRYPQDKCFKCMKKVYPMEKIGPVKGVVYHKGCFVCFVCGTRLNMKNYFLNREDDFDINIYCKVHQPVAKGKGADSTSVQIKGAMTVPKLDKVNEQIRGDTKYNMDQNAVEIRHAINVPAQDLQASNKLREKAWRKGDRKSECVPPENVVRYQDPVPEYDAQSYEKEKVENNPDYDTQ